ncbi:MAG: hypothetical protein ABIJ00_02770 [Candidatus Eisenbacteria bacterium]
MIPISIYTLIAGSLLLVLLILSGRRIPWIWLVLWGISPLLIVYLLNPGFRVYSFHSFMHGGIVYQILNGDIPPLDPLVAGHPVHYPWGPHLIAAGISGIFRVTPFYSLAFLNAASLVLVLVLIYKISRLLVDDDRAAILAVICSVYGVTVFIPEMLELLPDGFPAEIRGIPILHKFITLNTLPIGLVCFLLALYSAIRLLRGSHLVGTGMLLLASILGTGFFYPAFMPGIIATVATGLVVALVLHIGDRGRVNWLRAGLVLAATCIGLAVLRPYLTSVGAGTLSSLAILNWTYVGKNSIKYLLVAVPMLVIVLANLGTIRDRFQRPALFVVAAATLATMGSYVLTHLPFDNEYKFLLLSTVTLGILGGAVLGSLRGSYGKCMAFVLIGLLLIPSFRIVRLRVSRGHDVASTYVERGVNIHTTNEEENELYTWIRENTATNSVFIDRELEIPVLARRQLLVGVGGSRRPGQKGFGGINIILQFQSGYDTEMLNTRRRIVDRIYSESDRLTETEWDELRSLTSDIYVVARTPEQSGIQSQAGFKRVFASSDDSVTVYKLEIR